MIIKRKVKSKEEARIRAIKKEYENRRKKMLRTKYGQKPLKHAKKGIQSCIYAALVSFLLILMIVLSFKAKGEAGILMGFTGLATLFLAGMGLNTGIRGFRERDKNYITCKMGTAVNGVVLIGMTVIFIRGLI